MVFLLYSVTVVKPTSHSQDKSSENALSVLRIFIVFWLLP